MNAKSMKEKAVAKNLLIKEEEERKKKEIIDVLITSISHKIESRANNGLFFYETRTELGEEKERDAVISHFRKLEFRVDVWKNKTIFYWE